MKNVLLILLLPLLSSCSLVTLMTKGNSHPQLAGDLDVSGLNGPVSIRRDALGVPHVRAESEHDMWYGLGFVHAQDRLFQMDLSRHAAWGRLAEWFGPGAVNIDVFHRALALRDRGARNVEIATAEEREMLEAYAKGVNAGAASLNTLPVEYRLLGVSFEPWDAVDGTALGFLQSWNLETNSSAEMAALLMRDEWDAATIDMLYRNDTNSVPTDAYWDTLREADIGQLSQPYKAWTGNFGGRPDKAHASNNWVVGPERTASGASILASDPHLSQSVPSLWYAADLAAGDLHVAGVTLPGLPGFPVGHTQHVGWALTNVMADVVDYPLVERVGDDHYLLAGSKRALERKTIEVGVKDAEPVQQEVLLTEIGPVITANEGTHLVVFRWHAAELDDRMAGVLRGLATVQSMADTVALTELPLMVAQNVAMADIHGDFGWQSIGAIPKRKAHTGRVPYPASDPAHGWDGWHGVLMGERAPERGYVHTANTKPRVNHPADYREDAGEQLPVVDVEALSSSYIPPHRHDRLDALLAETREATQADVARMQLDLLDTVAQRLVPEWMTDGVGQAHETKRCGDALRAWDFNSTSGSPGAAVWSALQEEVLRVVLAEHLTEEGLDVYMQTASSGDSLLMGNLEPLWVDRDQQVERALERTCARMVESLGEDSAAWSWGALHPLALNHPFSASSSLLKGWNMPVVPWAGTGATVAAASYGWGAGPRRVSGMQSMRFIMPFDDLGAASLTYPGGQSGQPGSRFYRSHFQAFAEAQPLPLWFNEDDVAREALFHLVLNPTE